MNNLENNRPENLEEQLRAAFEARFNEEQIAPPSYIWDNIEEELNSKPQVPFALWKSRPLAWSLGAIAAVLVVVFFWLNLSDEKPSLHQTAQQIPNSASSVHTGSFDLSTPSTESTTAQKPVTSVAQDKLEIPKKTNPDASNEKLTTDNLNESHKLHGSDLESKGIVKTPDAYAQENNTLLNATSSSSSLQGSKPKTFVGVTNQDDKHKKSAQLGDDAPLVTSASQSEHTRPLLTPLVIQPFLFGDSFSVPALVLENINLPLESSTNEQKQDTKPIKKDGLNQNKGIFVILGTNYSQGVFAPSIRRDSSYSAVVKGATSTDINEVLPSLNSKGGYSQLGIDLGIHFGKHWSLNSGFAFGKSSFTFNTQNTYKVPVPNIQQGDALNLETENTEVSTTYQWVQVPITVGYQFGRVKAKQFTGFAQLGTSIALLQSYQYASSSDRFTYVLGKHQTTNAHILGNIGVSYHITDRWSIWGGGLYRSSLSSLIDEKGIDMTTQSYGWQMGTRFMLFRIR